MSLLKNSVGLLSMQASKMLLPLIIFPVLKERFSADLFAQLMYSQGIAVWVMIVVEYGFSYSATRELANKEYVQKEVISQVSIAKIKLCIISLIIPFVISCTPQWDGMLFLLLCGWMLGCINGLMPIFVFQYLEKTVSLIKYDVFCALITLVLVMLCKNRVNPSEVMLLLCLPRLALLILYYTKIINNYGFIFRSDYSPLKNNYKIFIYQISSSIYSSAALVIAGSILDVRSLAIFAISDKLIRAGQSLLTTVYKAFYTKNIKKKNNSSLNPFFNNFPIFVLSIISIVFTILFGKYAILLLFGDAFVDAYELLIIESVLFLAIAISNIYGVQYLLVNKKDKLFNIIIIVSSIVSLPMVFFMGKSYSASGIIVALVSIELLVALFMFISWLYLEKIKNEKHSIGNI